MMQEQRVPLGGRVDCISDEYAIEIEWAEDWYHAVGQSLDDAVVMKRKPGIILLCPHSSVHGEGLCRSYIYRLDAALSLVKVPVTDLGSASRKTPLLPTAFDLSLAVASSNQSRENELGTNTLRC